MNILYAILVAVVATLVSFLLGAFLELVVPVAVFGHFLQSYAVVIGVITGIVYLVSRNGWIKRV